jgi:hypothetical protein
MVCRLSMMFQNLNVSAGPTGGFSNDLEEIAAGYQSGT